MPDLIMVRDAQQVLHLSRAMVLKLANAGRLPVAVRLPNGTRLFQRADVERLAAERKQKAREK